MHIKQASLERGIKQLKGIIYLYRQTTEMLISDYIADSNETAEYTDAECGEVSMEIDAYHHPATGELEGTIRGQYVCKCECECVCMCACVYVHVLTFLNFIVCLCYQQCYLLLT